MDLGILRYIQRLSYQNVLLITLVLITFSEFLVYEISEFLWLPIKCKNEENCTRVLFVADPQLLGELNENSLNRYDADKYLAKTYMKAFSHAKPHIVCFLGDLLDEGIVEENSIYQNYVERFKKIYQFNDDVKYVHVPGDNDIGVDDGLYYNENNIKRFHDSFMLSDIFEYKEHLQLFEVNPFILSYPQLNNNSNNAIRIVLSHAPILIDYGPLFHVIINKIDPHILFSGHWHESIIFLHPNIERIQFYEKTVKHFDLYQIKNVQKRFLEIMVPTTSYRMGKINAGIGYGVFENHDFYYTVLWLPNRLIHIFLYTIWFFIVVLRILTQCELRQLKRYKRIDLIAMGIA